MTTRGSLSPLPRRALTAAVVAALVLTACANTPSKEEQEAARNTLACQLAGERLVLRYDVGEVRLLMPDGDRIALYQIPTATGARFSNGNVELRGKGMDLQIVRNGAATQLVDCQPYSIPK